MFRAFRPRLVPNLMVGGVMLISLLAACSAQDLAMRPQLPDNALEGGRDWINVRDPIHLGDLRGKIVLLDFWTYCCINCHHILPDLAKLEQKYPNALVVIGVHTAKFDAEKDTANIRKKVDEYGIKHPVINDADQVLWTKFQANVWPTLVLIDAEGRFVGAVSGEGHYATLDRTIGQLIAEHRKAGDLNETPLKFEPEDEKAHDSPLRYPGKILADAAGKRLFIADTAHNRIVVTDLDGKLIRVVGTGEIGHTDGPFERAEFHRPQGMCLVGDVLYVADTENHMIRAVNLAAQTVTTVAGTGQQAPFRARGGSTKSAPLSSPWDIISAPGNENILYIAMAGPHQIWKLDLKARMVTVWAGNGLENIIDGTRETASFAQPSGLATDGAFLYVADSEASGVRALSLRSNKVETVVGVDLFGFGDIDGKGRQVRLQHCLGLAFGQERLYIADSYNNKIKVCDPLGGTVCTLVGNRAGGFSDSVPLFNEPGGLSIAGETLYVADTNNHAIRAIDLPTRSVRTIALDGVTPPRPPKRAPSFPNPTTFTVAETPIQPSDLLTIQVTLNLPAGYKINPDAPIPYLVETPGQTGVLAATMPATGRQIDPPSATFQVPVALAAPAEPGGQLKLRLSVSAFLCQTSLCEIHNYVWEIPVRFTADAPSSIALSNSRSTE